MKIKFLSIAAIVTFFLASCGGVDKELVNNITSFDTDWKAVSTSFTGMADSIKTEAADLVKSCDETCSMECKDKKMAAHMDSCKKECDMNKADITSLLNNMTDFKSTTIDKITADFTAWKDKVMKGEIKTEEATKALAEYKTSLTNAKDQIAAFRTSFADLKNTCMSKCEDVKSCCSAEKKDK